MDATCTTKHVLFANSCDLSSKEIIIKKSDVPFIPKHNVEQRKLEKQSYNLKQSLLVWLHCHKHLDQGL